MLLCWWADALLKVLLNQDIQARVHFMAGPYAVDVARSFGMLNFRMIARDARLVPVKRQSSPSSLGWRHNHTEFLTPARSQEWWSTDADALELLLEKLELGILRF